MSEVPLSGSMFSVPFHHMSEFKNSTLSIIMIDGGILVHLGGRNGPSPLM